MSRWQQDEPPIARHLQNYTCCNEPHYHLLSAVDGANEHDDGVVAAPMTLAGIQVHTLRDVRASACGNAALLFVPTTLIRIAVNCNTPLVFE
jgi:hypothetical protein